MAAFLAPMPWASQLEVACTFWHSADCVEIEGLQPFFQFYSEQCNMVYHAFRGRIPLQSHEDVKVIATLLRQDRSRSELREILQTRSPGTYQTEVLDGAIDLVARLMTMLDIGRFPATSFSGRHSITWDRGTLQEFLHELFPGTVRRNDDGIKIEATFNIRQLDRIGGLSIMLTTNLADHLLLLPEKDAVLIYHHATFLLNQDESVVESTLKMALTFTNDSSSALFPAGLVEETLNTLALLFPRGDVEVEKWYVRQGRDNIIDKAVLSCKARERDIGEFRYWHDRLVALLQRFEHPRQTTLKQAWFDRRNGAQWYSLWFAIGLTLLFGLIQSIEGAIQVYKAYQDA